MSLRPTAIAEKDGVLYVVLDEGPDYESVLLLPCSFAHRQVVMRGALAGYEMHTARTPEETPKRGREGDAE